MRLEGFTVRRLDIPLAVPAHTSVADIDAFDTILIEAAGADGAVGFGEATLPVGYALETREQGWIVACKLAEVAAGMAGENAVQLFERSRRVAPFTVAALTTAVEMMMGHPALAEKSGPVELVGLVDGRTPETIEETVAEAVAAGHEVLKVPVGWGLDSDLERIEMVRRTIGGGATRLRIAADQAYTVEDAVTFVRSIADADIECVEQPCVADDWDAAVVVKSATDVPIMLDASIFDLSDIERAAALKAADLIKLTLMKSGGLSSALEALRRVIENGMTPVVGNMLQSDLACWIEARLAGGAAGHPAEMIGFQKMPAGLLAPSLDVADGALIPADTTRPTLDRETVGRLTGHVLTFPAA